MSKRERIFIIPTRYGILYGFGVFITLLAGIIYSNNLVYLLSFFLVAVILIGMVQTHSNLKGLNIEKLQMELAPAFSQGNAKIWIKSTNNEGHNQIQINTTKNNNAGISFMVPNLTGATLSIERFAYTTQGRGKKSVEQIRLSTTFPFGLFYAWRFFDIKTNYYVYPQPFGNFNLPENELLGDSVEKIIGVRGDDFTQHKKYSYGESHKHIDWKAYARGRPLLVKEFKDGDNRVLSLDIQNMSGHIEAKLQQLVKWIDDCETKKIIYSLKLDDQFIGPGLGQIHKKECLKSLAEYPNYEAS
ncbi:MAG: DUF58 domain-containing protein [Bdellovibrionales bacterium]|nr:DUF58 domain-containing protein [Bdellovibrionales bacterium]